MIAIILDRKRWFHTACTPCVSRRATRLHGTLPVRIEVITMEREAVVGPLAGGKLGDTEIQSVPTWIPCSCGPWETGEIYMQWTLGPREG